MDFVIFVQGLRYANLSCLIGVNVLLIVGIWLMVAPNTSCLKSLNPVSRRTVCPPTTRRRAACRMTLLMTSKDSIT